MAATSSSLMFFNDMWAAINYRLYMTASGVVYYWDEERAAYGTNGGTNAG